MTLTQECTDCKDGKEHFHIRKVIVEHWQPSKYNIMCHCGKSFDHQHKEERKIWIPKGMGKRL